MSAIMSLNPKAELARASAAMEVNISAARSLQEIMKCNLGPRGTLKMLVSGGGDIKLTKDGNILLKEMSIQHPTASMIARASTAQDDITGDGTTSAVLLIGELLKQAEIYIAEGMHPRPISEGFEIARDKCMEVLEKFKVAGDSRDILLQVAKTSLRTKLRPDMADSLSESLVEAVGAIRKPNEELDLHMVEIQEMTNKSDMETQLVKGLVLDHGARHPDMPKHVTNAYILTCNVSLEYEKTEVNSSFFYKTSEEREKMVAAERAFIDERIKKLVALKRQVCDTPDKHFVIINQKGIDPPSLDVLAREGIIALRRAKRRNMERLQLAVGGVAVNAFDDLTPDTLGHAGLVYEHVVGEEKFTFVEECANPASVTLLIKGPNKHTITQIKDAIHDGLRAIKNTIDDGAVVPGAGSFEIACAAELERLKQTVKGKPRLGVQAFADALLVIPKTLATNSGFDAMDVIAKLQEEHSSTGQPIGVDVQTGEALMPADHGIWDNVVVKKQLIDACQVMATNLLLVDEIMRAGMSSLK